MTEPEHAHDGPAFWVNTVSLEHVRLGVDGGFTQAGHGRPVGLKRLHRGDGLVFYSPRTAIRGGQPLQQFTALGRIADTEPYRVKVSADFHPWRRRMDFLQARAAAVPPMVADLDFIPDPKRWGYPFRRGLFQIGSADFLRIAAAMGTDWDAVVASRRAQGAQP